MESIRRSLTCLEYPKVETFDIDRKSDFTQLVSWLEDRKIRELEIDERDGLRSNDEGIFDSAFSGYVSSLGCPFQYSAESKIEVLYWLISYAIDAEYEDSEEALSKIEQNTTYITSGDDIHSNNVLLGEAIDNLGKLMYLDRLPEEKAADFLHRVSRKVKLTLSYELNKNSSSNASSSTAALSIQDFPLGFDTTDELVNQLSIVMKMLYLFDFRELQNDLNSLIVLGQEYTSNPKTNSSLGRVGR
jgi:RNA transcription, translation and transport factor protein